ncbi:proline iminopeptidase-family hydrolase [Streptomyces filamentosus]|uniref:Proline iminopeptidase n=2 Tax=Streptomyces filamentosus TaxID=67294 RepID=A0ABY4UQK0_STRFL|nr:MULTISPECIES: proline iminopeptidase-family hydrolase [Streptomyces]EFE78166.1 proline iminopeptidase [Streptomyces filamentosus NRRL 15998]MYR82060.1 proline iminopeptidase-family hydrolase [Streptomyces sp. SID5466]USC46496.1 proline iminopeptidase-family hydrolase [Streptomyces filamentosus]
MAVAAGAKGRIPFREYRTWYRLTGTPGRGRPAVVVVHGGPGSTHDYLIGLSSLSEDGWPVVHYDQLGNGGSTHLPDAGADFWTVGLFLEELDNLLRHLGVADDYVLVGQSWGGMLAARHAADRPGGLRGLVIANSPASYPLWRQEMEALRAALPPGVDATLRAHEVAGTTHTEEYAEAVKVFNDRHVCRVRPLPPAYVASVMETANDPTVYHTMNGPSEFHVVGTLKDWSVEDRLPDIAVPTLVLSGRHDEATPATVRPFLERISDVRWEILEESSHMPHLEEPELFHATLVDFLKSLDGRRSDG